jgi:hypothetical protein
MQRSDSVSDLDLSQAQQDLNPTGSGSKTKHGIQNPQIYGQELNPHKSRAFLQDNNPFSVVRKKRLIKAQKEVTKI